MVCIADVTGYLGCAEREASGVRQQEEAPAGSSGGVSTTGALRRMRPHFPRPSHARKLPATRLGCPADRSPNTSLHVGIAA